MTILNRRGFIKSAPIAAAIAALPATALAFKAPITETPDLPDWWHKKTQVLTKLKDWADNAIPHGDNHDWACVKREQLRDLIADLEDEMTPEAAVMAHAGAIHDTLRETAPEGSVVDCFLFFSKDNRIDPNSVRATANIDAMQFARFDPSVSAGWSKQTRTWRV